jgi:hypothetical protein
LTSTCSRRLLTQRPSGRAGCRTVAAVVGKSGCRWP